ncbi:MAG: putative resolvase/invertase/recombinase [Myxococcales bacterium]
MGSTKTTRAALYARVSTTDQNAAMQVAELRRAAEQRGWSVVGEFVDDGVSGVAESRPALDRMMAAAKAGKLDVVAVWKLDRLGRSLQHLVRLLDDLQRYGVGFVSLHDAGIDTTSQGRLLLHVLASFAAYERDLIVERVRAGVARARAEGRHVGRPRVDLDLRAARALLTQGHSVRDVASMLDLPRTTLRRRLSEGGRSAPAGGSAGPEVAPADPM